MPCRCDGYDEGVTISKQQADDVQVITRLACEYCETLETRFKNNPIPDYAKDWWKRHKKEDKARRDKEESENKEKKIRQIALSKLTNEEKKILGIR